MRMYSLISRCISENGLFGAIYFIIRRFLHRTCGRMHGFILGWNKSTVPILSRVINPNKISVGQFFYAASPVWIEAVVRYKEQYFSPQIEIGSGFSCSDRLHISCINKIRIGNDCLLGSNVYIGDHGHGGYSGDDQSSPCEPPAMRRLVSTGHVVIGDRCWIGDNVVIVGPAQIGNGVVVAANSVVKGNFPDDCMIAGAPAKVVRVYDKSIGKWVRQG